MSSLQEMRKRRKYTQYQLAAVSGVPQQTISSIESGERKNPGVLTMRRLADALQCTIDELYPPVIGRYDDLEEVTHHAHADDQ